MFDNQMRRLKDVVFAPLGQVLGHIPPASFTLMALLLGLGTAVTLYFQLYLVAFLGWFFNRVFDALDGVVARQQGSQSDFGGYLDIVSDFVVYAVIPIGLVLGRPSATGFMLLAVLLACYYVNAASWIYLAAILEKRAIGAALQGEQTAVTMPVGLIGGTETIVFYALFILFPGWYLWLFALLAALVVLTIFQRLVWAYRRIR
ncbi:MAG: CDP-alcohol phosphatidyltransferase family protein [Anaerolineales bacterium]|nr:CDP-alcohol phosphatidyltransferase family protein [Anaerolineales bacterium]